MYYAYASDPRMKLNLGIRRRLAPLLENDRRRIELMNCLLLTLPGTPIIYYGDEIGMGDNVHLGDRNGVRTPMQWSSNRNADFSTAEAEALYLPVVNDPIYGHQVVNVAAQAKTPSSLLNTMKRLIAARRQARAFGRGTIELLHPRNQAILAFLRRWEDEIVPVELDLTAHGGAVPIELLGQTRFPPISDRPYFLSLGPHGFYWFRLEPRERGPVRYGIEATAI